MPVIRYPIRLGRRSMPLLRLFGVGGQDDAWAELRPATDGAEDSLRGSVGSRSRRQSRTSPGGGSRGRGGGSSAIGVRMNWLKRETSFAGSPRGGVRVDFRTPIRWLRVKVPAFYVGVDDVDAFASALAERGIPGEDARKR